MSSFVDDEGRLRDQAVAACGYDDFGDETDLEGLHVLLESLDQNRDLNPLGKIAIRHMIVRDLKARLVAEHGFKSWPESQSAAIEAPLVIVGLPRTGTTALQELLSVDPNLQGLELWLTRAPKPRPMRAQWPDDLDYQACTQEMKQIREFQPELHAIHKMDAGKADECWYLMSQSFVHSSWLAQTQLPEYRAWFEQVDKVPVYKRHRRNLQLIGSREPGKRWLMKDSTHLFGLDAFLEVYPDARVVQTHRDPVESIPSVCGLCWTARKTLNESESSKTFGELTTNLWHMGVEQTRNVRIGRNQDQFFDVSFPRFKAEPMAVVDEIYAHFGLERSDETRAAMDAFRKQNSADKAPLHRYAASDWELDVDEIRARFSTYRNEQGFF